MKDIVILGAGGFGREVAALLKRINRNNPTWNMLGFYDDNATESNEYGQILGKIDDVNNVSSPLCVVIAVGNPKYVKAIRERLINPYLSFPNIIAPEAAILDESNYHIGEGNILSSFSSISCNVSIGNFNILNNRVSFGHDVVVKDYNVFMTACRISGNCNINTLNLFGVASIVIPGIKVGKGVVLSPGSVLIRGPKDDSTYVGNPAKLLNY